MWKKILGCSGTRKYGNKEMNFKKYKAGQSYSENSLQIL